MSEPRIQSLQDVLTARRWENRDDLRAVINRIEQRLRNRMPRSSGAAPALTNLQIRALNHPEFWGSWENGGFRGNDLIIQGATSAGKTLISELSILDCLGHDKQALVLVPLKAMVHERYNQFRMDLAPGDEYKIYASSSDYLDMDEDLIRGDYSVGILVYEKLFAMLCQPNCQILNNCGLIVVDELSMLEKDERGPKLEIALEKAKTDPAAPRIICLTTIDCEADRICEWLSIAGREADDEESAKKATVICAQERPVGLNEYITTLDGKYKLRHIPGEREQPVSEPLEEEGRFDVAQMPGASSAARKRALTVEILTQLYQRRPDAKTLIFIPSQSGVRYMASYLAEHMPGLFPRQDLADTLAQAAGQDGAEDLYQKLQRCDQDEDMELLRDTLLPCGIAYHHGSMSTNLRESIEELFEKVPDVKVIVATETLTVGINLPIDAVIIYSNEVPHGKDIHHPLTKQEYRNYIGRAGRLGLTDARGESYLLLETNELKNKYWNGYHQENDQITSALIKADEEAIAPYYLNLLVRSNNNRFFTRADIDSFYNRSLSRICGRGRLRSDELIELLTVYELAKQNAVLGPVKMRKNALNDIGVALAPYAFSLSTTYQLRYTFVLPKDPESAGTFGTGLPEDITAEDIAQDRFLLDILFRICRHDELANSSALSLPSMSDVRDAAEIRSKLYLALYALLPDAVLEQYGIAFERPADAPDERCALWEGSYIALLFLAGKTVPEWAFFQDLFRTLLMYYWTKGRTVSEIKRILGMDSYVRYSGGDLERFAEVASYHLDAAYRIVPYRFTVPGRDAGLGRLAGAVYSLSTRVKYGMPRDTVNLANRHLHGLDRSRILMLGRAAKACGMETLDYLRTAPTIWIEKYITQEQRRKLLQKLQSRYSHGSFPVQLKNLDDDYQLSAEVRSGLEHISQYQDKDAAQLFQLLGSVLEYAPNACLSDCAHLQQRDYGRPACGRVWRYPRYKAGDKDIYAAYLPPCDGEEGEPDFTAVRAFLRSAPAGSTRLLLAGGNATQPLYDAHAAGVPFTLGITCENLAELIVSSIWVGKGTDGENGIAGKGSADLLFDLLKDARGIPLKLTLSSTNYTPENASERAQPRFRLLMDQDQSEYTQGQLLRTALQNTRDLSNFQLLPWGAALENGSFADAPTVILLNKEQIVSRHSLTDFLYTMEQSRFQNCLVLVERSGDQQSWNDPSSSLAGMPWRGGNCNCRVVYCPTIQERIECIREFVGGWQRKRFLIGVSYAHYDGRVDADQDGYDSDVQALRKLVGRLNAYYGEQRILFDENPTAQCLFHGDQARSLAGYSECSLGLILYNTWTQKNAYCADERAALQKQADAGRADLFYLQASRSGNPALPAGKIMTLLPRSDAECDALVVTITRRLRELAAPDPQD